MQAEVFTLTDGEGLRAQFTNLGASWLSCRVLGREVLLGHAQLRDYGHDPNALGGVAGRFTNRIGGARFTLDGREHLLSNNDNGSCLHGGAEGFHRRLWAVRLATERELRLSLHSPDGDQGFPGAIDVELAYRIDGIGELTMVWVVRAGSACPVSLASQAFFNLDGSTGSVAGHRLRIAAEKVLQVNDRSLPVGDPLPVAGTRYDLRDWKPMLGRDAQGYDHCFAIGPNAVVEAESADRQLRLQLKTTLPGVQFNTGRRLDHSRGRDGHRFAPFAGFALHGQFWPDSPNHPDWPSCVVRPGQLLAQRCQYKFSRP